MDQEVTKVWVPSLTEDEPLLSQGYSGSVGQQQVKVLPDSVAYPGGSYWVVGGNEKALLLSSTCRCWRPSRFQQLLSVLSASLQDSFLYDLRGVAASEEVGGHHGCMFVKVFDAGTDPANSKKLTVWKRVVIVPGVGRGVQQIVVRICGFGVQVNPNVACTVLVHCSVQEVHR